MQFKFGDETKIKLIIWDLDETFWKGTLSDNSDTVIASERNIELIKKLAKRGIVSSVCSKNDENVTLQKLAELGIWDYFVFNSINWEAKGNRIKNTIEAMALRSADALFIDDNTSNLAEAEYYMPDIMTATPNVIDYLAENVNNIGKSDDDLSRLNQYKVLEQKKKDSDNYSSNTDFLKQSGIKVFICEDKEKLLGKSERIEELIQRTNQLNFTKKRIELESLVSIIKSSEYRCGYVEVKDNYGDYGLVGFYAIINGIAEHFLFSCRTMGMGIEQYVYSLTGCPKVDTVAPVSGEIHVSDNICDYIERVDFSWEESKEDNKHKLNILLKGPCDLEVMATYIESGNHDITKEFNFVDKDGLQADFYNHSVNILNSINEDKKEDALKLVSDYSFLSAQALETDLLNPKYDVICLSTLMDATLGVYRNVVNDNLIPYGLYNKNICDRGNHTAYINGDVMTAHNKVEASELIRFSNEFIKVDWEPKAIALNFHKIVDKIFEVNSKAQIVILMLPELEYITKREYPMQGKEAIHKAINEAIRAEFAETRQVYLLEVNKFVRSQDDYFDSINHYSKMVYYKIAKELSGYVSSATDTEIVTTGKFKAFIDHIRRLSYKKRIKL